METERENKRKEKAERAKNLVDDAVNSLAASLEKGHSEGLKLHLGVIAKFRRYSLSNILLIANQRPDATHVEGFRTWAKLGRQVKKGEKGIWIRAPFVFRSRQSVTRFQLGDFIRIAGGVHNGLLPRKNR